MLHTALGFMTAMTRSLAKPWWPWLGALMMANGIAPLFFWNTIEAKATLAAFVAAFGIQLLIFRAYGFVRLLGIGHILPWTPLLLWLAGRLEAVASTSPFGMWLYGILALNGISLLIDLVDFIRYLRGEREASYVLEQA